MPRKRDSQRSKVYNAESALPSGDYHESWQDLNAYIDSITRTRWWKANVARDITIKDGRGTRTAWCTGYELNLPRWARHERSILHELAHAYSNAVHGQRVAGHGREFCACYLEIVGRFMGKDAKRTLQASFKEHRVKFRRNGSKAIKPRKRCRVLEEMFIL